MVRGSVQTEEGKYETTIYTCCIRPREGIYYYKTYDDSQICGVALFQDCLLYTSAVDTMRRALNGMRADEAADNILNMFSRTRNNAELIQMVKKPKLI